MTQQLHALHVPLEQHVNKGLKVKETIGVIKPKITMSSFYIAPHFTAALHLHLVYHITLAISTDTTDYVGNALKDIQRDCSDKVNALKILLAIITIFGFSIFFLLGFT